MPRTVIGLDFGTLSARAVLCDAQDGRELASAVSDYRHGVLDRTLPTGEALPRGWALQHPADYLEALYEIIPAVLQKSGVSPEDVAGIGIDTTGSTLLAVAEDGTPLCLTSAYAREKHAWPKLWKHHSPAPYAEKSTRSPISAARLSSPVTAAGSPPNGCSPRCSKRLPKRRRSTKRALILSN